MSKKKKKDWSPLKSLIVFQVRLIFDAVRDFVLSPLSFVCIILDILTGQKVKKQSLFYKLMLKGRDSDKWINLFEQYPDVEKGDREKEDGKSEEKT